MPVFRAVFGTSGAANEQQKEPTGAPQFAAHDQTHLELTLRYGVNARPSYEWEMYAFVPKSFRLRHQAYVRDNLYDDLQSRFRLALAPADFGALADRLGQLGRVSRTDEKRIVAELQLFANAVRAAAVAEQQALLDALETERCARVEKLLLEGPALAARMRDALSGLPSSLGEAARRVDEHVSRVLEVFYGTLSRTPNAIEGVVDAVPRLAEAAANEARYRQGTGFGGVGTRDLSERDAEHLEFRAHALKRFAASVLWLKADVRTAGMWAKHLFYAVAAGLAMSFSVVAAFWHGPQTTTFANNLLPWAIAVIVAYMGKDRVKALLQDTFSGWLSKYFPDRVWKLSWRGKVLAAIREESGFLSSRDLPDEIRAVRERNDRGWLSRIGRHETVLWHRKEARLRPGAVGGLDPRFDAIIEIFRLDLCRWLTHADDPTRTIVFADPEDGVVYESPARRAYNIQLVYRLRGAGESVPWRRARVVVTRKGILRVDDLENGWEAESWAPDTLSEITAPSKRP